MIRKFIAFIALATGVLVACPAYAANSLGGATVSGSGVAAQCTGTQYAGLGTSGTSPNVTITSSPIPCTVFLDSGSASDTFNTVTLTLPTTNVQATTRFNVVTTRAISALTFVDGTGDTTPIYVNGQTTPTIASVTSGEGIAVIYTGGGAHIQPGASVLASSGSGSVGGGTGSFAVASGSGTGFGAGQAARVADLRAIEGVNIQPWWAPDEVNNSDSGGPFADPETKQNNCAFSNGNSLSGCTANVGCTSTYDDTCYPNEAAFFIYGLQYLGIKKARTSFEGSRDTHVLIANAIPGMMFDEGDSIPGQHGQTLTATQSIALGASLSSMVEAFEGANEPDQSSDNEPSSYDGQTSYGGMNLAFTADLRSAMTAAGFSSTFPLYGPSITTSCNAEGGTTYGCYGDYYNMGGSSRANFANQHDYLASDYPLRGCPTGNCDAFTDDYSHQTAVYGSPAPPLVITETGVPQNPYPQGWGYEGAVNSDLASKFDTALILRAWRDGVKKDFTITSLLQTATQTHTMIRSERTNASSDFFRSRMPRPHPQLRFATSISF